MTTFNPLGRRGMRAGHYTSWPWSRAAVLAVGLLGGSYCAGANAALTCNITVPSSNVTIQAGQSVNYTGTVSGGKSQYTFNWTFQGGTPGTKQTKTSATSNSVTGVTYNTAGTYTTTLAVTDSTKPTAQTCSTNPTRTITVQAAGGDTTAPTVSLSSSPVGPTYTTAQTVTINANATDNVGVTKVDFYDGGVLTATDTSSPFSYAWSINAASNGTHNWTAKAYDAANNVGTSSVLARTVNIAGPNVSINSTSETSSVPINSAVTERPKISSTTSGYSVLAINDLGMHCGDYDTRVASILPPFQVLLSQVVKKGSTGLHPALNPSGITVQYSAASNSGDPILSQSGVFLGVRTDGSTYKTNFWDGVAKGTYDPFYPGGLGITPLATGGFPTTADIGLPVPNVYDLYIGPDGIVDSPAGLPGSHDGFLSAVQHAMPGLSNNYVVNIPQLAEEYYTDKPFFVNFPFGYVAAKTNWFEAAGVPFAAFDDFGRRAAYPLVRVEAMNGSTPVATVDTVLPISGEASCANCHGAAVDVPSAPNAGIATNRLGAAGLPVASSMSDPDNNMPDIVSVEYGSDINILRLHDLKHGSKYVSYCSSAPCPSDACTLSAASPNGTASCLTNKALVQNKPVVCQTCHYTPALDLAHVGPKAGAPGTEANGRNQVAHQSNSRVMHNHHGLVDTTGLSPGDVGYNSSSLLFPAIVAPTQDANGVITNQSARTAALENSCYQCHPGTAVKCLRGPMLGGGMLCSDCHGSMAQVGNDFSKNVSPTNPGAFLLAKDFYTNPATPRVPWANEPGCGSCHTGDASSSLSGTGYLKNVKDVYGSTDNIRLLQAYKTGDAKATPIIPTNKRFAEPVVPATFTNTGGTTFANPGAGNPQLYRVSVQGVSDTGHGQSDATKGLMCEGCHGATHAEWPNANPASNDNVAATQLQGHSGVIVECSTCHGNELDNSSTLAGPHGLHPVGANTPFASRTIHGSSTIWGSGGYSDATYQSKCQACHGGTSRSTSTGTVLSRAFVQRTLRGQTVTQGTPIACTRCH